MIKPIIIAILGGMAYGLILFWISDSKHKECLYYKDEAGIISSSNGTRFFIQPATLNGVDGGMLLFPVVK